MFPALPSDSAKCYGCAFPLEPVERPETVPESHVPLRRVLRILVPEQSECRLEPTNMTFTLVSVQVEYIYLGLADNTNIPRFAFNHQTS